MTDKLPYRQIHMDFHTSPHIGGVGARFDGEEFAAVLKAAHVNSINLFAKCHHGMYYYPTKIGTMHPGLKGFDLLGAQVGACRKAGIRVCVYTCAAWNEDWADRHPEWLQKDARGVLGCKEPFSARYYGWRHLCLNRPEYRAVLKAELMEICKLYRPSGYWIDIIIQNGCVCDRCAAEMKQSGLDPQDPAAVARHDRLVEIGFMKEFYEFIRDMDTKAMVYFNGYSHDMDLRDDPEATTHNKRLHNSYLDIESLPSDLWGYAHFPIAVNYLNHRGQELAMMNGKFHMAWGDFGSLRNAEALEYECFRALACGAKVCVGDQLHPSGRIDRTVYERIGKVFESVEAKEPWLHGTEKIAQIGVYASNKVLEPVSPSSEGAYRILTEGRHQYDFIDYRDNISRYELVILPDTVALPPEAAEKLEAYLNGGGKALLTGNSGLRPGGAGFALDAFGLNYLGEADYCPRYMRLDWERFPGIPPMDYVAYERGAKVSALPGAEILGRTVNPYFNRTYDRFCSHRQTPPDAVTDEPCVARSGNVVYISNPLFRDYALNGNKVFKDIVLRCIGLLLERPLVKADLPTTAEVTLRRRGDGFVLHILNYLIQRKCRNIDTIEEKLPLYDRAVAVRTERRPKAVRLVPEGVELAFDWADGYARFVVPEINGHRMVSIE